MSNSNTANTTFTTATSGTATTSGAFATAAHTTHSTTSTSSTDVISTLLANAFYSELLKTEDFMAFESFVACDIRVLGARALVKCLESFDEDIYKNIPRKWSVHEHAPRTLVTLLGVITFTRTIFLDEYGRHRALLDELLGIPPRSRISSCAFVWIAECASELSYRKTARKFEDVSGAYISHITVKNIVHKEGKLLVASGAEYARAGSQKISQDKLFVETDGLWVHTQVESHRREALPRFLYEQARKTQSFELKIAALYAGKLKVAPGRFKRGGLCLTCLDDTPDSFWNRVWNMLCENYEQDDVERIDVGGDGAVWCNADRLDTKVGKDCKVSFTLDLFHIMEKIVRAFPDEESSKRMWAINLLMRGRAKKLCEMCKRIEKKMTSGKAKRKVQDLLKYISEHVYDIKAPTHSMGTMEGTNAHVGAARLKGHGRSWSRAGACAMCLIRCALLTGRKLVAPIASSWFSKRELKAKEDAMPQTATDIPSKVGHGQEMPIQSVKLPKGVEIALARARC